jgi:hypothetical protein
VTSRPSTHTFLMFGRLVSQMIFCRMSTARAAYWPANVRHRTPGASVMQSVAQALVAYGAEHGIFRQRSAAAIPHPNAPLGPRPVHSQSID